MSKIIGGSPFGRADAIIDTEQAVLLGDVAVAMVGVGRVDGVETAIALELGGRVNKSTTRHETLYLLDADGPAVLIAELLGVADRAHPAFLNELLTKIAALPKAAS
jgi:hypothetical protein